MLFEAAHETRYAYSRPVFLEPVILRLRPRSDIFQRLLRYAVSFTPAPSGTTDFVDAEGNAVTRAWFSELTESLVINTSFVAETLVTDPFDYVVLNAASEAMPPAYSQEERRALARFLHHDPDPGAGEAARTIASGAGSVAGFLMEASLWVAGNVEQIHRAEGTPLPPAETLRTGRGACRDLTVLFMQICREAGIACRFVSGYEAAPPEETGENELHAWAEAYLPEAGWRGYDPSRGLAVGDKHLAVAAAPSPEGAAPFQGSFRGTGVTARMEARITM